MNLKFDLTPFLKLNQAYEGRFFEKIKRTITQIMLDQKTLVFRQERDPSGKAWKPLAKLTLNNKDHGLSKAQLASQTAHKILTGKTGELGNSLTETTAPYAVRTSAGTEISIGTNVPYAAIHQFGGVITPKNKKALMIPMAGGVIFAKKVTIPARPFLGFGDKDAKEINEYLAEATEQGTKP